jgi:hypothetical protein
VELSIACAMNDRRIAETYLLPSLDGLDGDAPVRFLLDNQDNAISRNLAQLYNTLARLDGPPIRIFTHADVRFPADFARRIASVVVELERRGVGWGALGTVGRSWQGDYVWGHDLREPVEVCTVDACCAVIDTRHRMSFDEHTFDGFHCHVEDYCLQSHAAERGVFVIPSELDHIGATYAHEGSQWGQYSKYRKRLERKWRRRFPNLTTT